MGWTVLYVGFGFVALWLLGEVLLQYKARLRWRLLAFTGFLGVVFGVLLHSVPVIVVGAIAFAVGQLYVTLSFRRGFSMGWAIKAAPREKTSKRRRARGAGVAKDPVLEVSELEYEQPVTDRPGGQDELDSGHDGVFARHSQDHEGYEQSAYGSGYPADDDGFGYDGSAYPPHTPEPDAAQEQPEPMAAGVYAPQPMPDDTGQYGIYSETAYGTGAQYGTGYDQSGTGYGQNGPSYDGQYGYGGDQQQYPAYSDPYIGAGQYGASYGGQQQYTDPYADQYASDTPPGGVWVPQQRDTEPAHGAPYDSPYAENAEHPGQQQPYQGGQNGYNEQQRY